MRRLKKEHQQERERMEKEGVFDLFTKDLEFLLKAGQTWDQAWDTLLSSRYLPSKDQLPETNRRRLQESPLCPQEIDSGNTVVAVSKPAPVKKKAQKLDVGLVIQWVFENLDVDHPPDEPHAGATAFLEFVRASVDNRSWFFQSMFSKLMPTRQQLEVADRFRDDGRNVLDVIKRIQDFEEEQA